uniref:Uncharacterized protein n=1 Tax=Timema genevievae TaxID=629358 RepID=A0A7R9PSZ6_TIMGE|nr:unnamed protein product [Timema genevievae]
MYHTERQVNSATQQTLWCMHYAETQEKVQAMMKDGRVCVNLCGDHSLSIGTIDGHAEARGNVAVLLVNAHADLNTADTSLTRTSTA